MSSAALGGSGPEFPSPRTGVQVSIDWLEMSAKCISLDRFRTLLAKHCGQQFGPEGLQTMREDKRFYDAKGPLGVRVRMDRTGQEDRNGRLLPWAGFKLPGEACRAIGTPALLALAEELGRIKKTKVSRLDVACDDFDRSFSPRLFAEACVDGNLDDENARLSARAITRVHRDKWNWSRTSGGCFWVGGPKSERRLRVYDKDRESKGEIPSTRIELQNRDRFACELLARILAARARDERMADVFFNHLVAFIDLREPTGGRSGTQKWRRLGWWANLVGEARAATTAGADASGVVAWLKWMVRQSRGFLSVMLRDAGVTPEGFAAPEPSPETASAVCASVRALLGGTLPKLSPEQQVRLKQLQQLRETRASGEKREPRSARRARSDAR